MTFKEMGLNPQILKAIKELGFENPTQIQKETIPFVLKNDRDLKALAQTGTGKTAAFGLPILEKLNMKEKNPQVIILCPTRELCVQITSDLTKYAKYLSHIQIASIYGGANIETQIRKLKQGVHIITATPGRMLDIIKRKKVDLSKIKTLVLDEADEMLNMGFKDELDAILEKIPETKNTHLFSATMPKEIDAIAKKYMHEPYEVTIGKKNIGAENVSHEYYMVHSKDRYLALKRIVDVNTQIYGIIFCRTRKETKDIADYLITDGYRADALHGDLSQAQREIVTDKFRNKHIQLLVATDVAARGLDIKDLTHIINYNLPDEIELYTHRSGRTGRAGKQGSSIAIINIKEKNLLKKIERIIDKKFIYKPVPTGKEICEKQLFYLIDKMQNVKIDEEKISSFLESIYQKLENLSKEEVIKRFVSVEFNRFLEYYKDAKDINIPETNNEKSYSKNGRDTRGPKANLSFSKNLTRFFISVGRKDKIKNTDLINFIYKTTKVKNIKITGIDLMGTYSFFNVDKSFSNTILNSFNNAEYKGRKIIIEPAEELETSQNRKRKRRRK